MAATAQESEMLNEMDQTIVGGNKRITIPMGDAYTLRREVEDAYDDNVKQGLPPSHAAWGACYDWDILELSEDS